MSQFVLRLFVSGRNPAAEAARRNLEAICRDHIPGGCEILLTDVQAEPEVAEAYRVMATPLLIKESPAPVRRILGDLTDRRTLLAALGLPVGPDEPNPVLS